MELKQLHGNDSPKPNNGTKAQPPPYPHGSQQNGDSKPFIASSSKPMMMPGRYRARFGTYQVTRCDKSILITAVILNCFLVILAGGALFVGIFLHTDRGSYADLCSDNEWFVAASCMIAVGGALLLFIVIAFIGIFKKSSRVLGLFIGVLIFLLIGEITAGVYAFVRRSYIESRFKACMKDAYQHRYKDPAFKHVTKAWDKFQERFDCCGVDSPLDYQSNSRLSNPPKSCGGMRQDAFARQPCFEVIKREVLDNFFWVGGAALGIAVIQLAAVIFNVMLLWVFHKREEYE